MDKHVTVVAALHIGFGALGVLISFIVLFVVVGAGLFSGDEEAIAITSVVGPLVAFVVCLYSVPRIIGGFGLLKHKSWARILILIMSVLALVNIPVGTAIGVYSIWVLVRDETLQLFKGELQSIPK